MKRHLNIGRRKARGLTCVVEGSKKPKSPKSPPPAGWSAKVKSGDRVEMKRGKVWWPMVVVGQSGGLLKLRSPVREYATQEGAGLAEAASEVAAELAVARRHGRF